MNGVPSLAHCYLCAIPSLFVFKMEGEKSVILIAMCQGVCPLLLQITSESALRKYNFILVILSTNAAGLERGHARLQSDNDSKIC